MRSSTGELARRMRPLVPVALMLVLLLSLILLHRHLTSDPNLQFPPGKDQINYLNQTSDFQNHLLVNSKVPLYTIWMGLFYRVNHDLYWCFYAEKFASIFLLSVLVAFLGRKLFDNRTGLFLGFWTLNCKYLVLESNGTNALAASMLVAGALCLTSKRRHLRWPGAVFFLFLSTAARPEMLVPFFIIIAYMALRALMRLRSRHEEKFRLPSNTLYWVGVIIGAALLIVFFKTHANPSTPWAINIAYFCSFAVNYVARNSLSQQYPHPWESVSEIVHRVMPNVTEPFSGSFAPLIQAFRFYPRECLDNSLFNIRMAAKVLPAIVLGLHSRVLMLVAFALYVSSYFLIEGSGRETFKEVPRAVWRDLLVWALAAASLIPVTIVFIIMWRYYLPLLPVVLISAGYVIHRGLSMIQRG